MFFLLNLVSKEASPRVCGAADEDFPEIILSSGIPTCVRGRRVMECHGRGWVRNIPACAGADKPDKYGIRTASGTPPRMQGSLHAIDLVPVDEGNIPACAGQPVSAMSYRRLCKVHPRVFGVLAISADCN